MKTIEEVGASDQMLADYSVDFIKRSVQEKMPFYLVHAFSKVHNDNYPPRWGRARPDSRTRTLSSRWRASSGV